MQLHLYFMEQRKKKIIISPFQKTKFGFNTGKKKFTRQVDQDEGERGGRFHNKSNTLSAVISLLARESALI